MSKEEIIKEIVNGIWNDLTDRSGYDLGCLGQSLQLEIRQEWEGIVLKALEKSK